MLGARLILFAGVTAGQLIQPSTVTLPAAFPTSLFSKYYGDPTRTDVQVQPVISDPITHKVYPLKLTSPDTIPNNNTQDPHPLPPTASSSRILSEAIAQVKSIANNSNFGSNCAKCQAGLAVAKFLALAAPEQGPDMAVELCNYFKFSSTCGTQFSRLALGSVITQVVANADVGGVDGQSLCNNFLSGLCPVAPATPLDLTGWFAKPKPDPLPAPKQPSGKRLKVLHMSDIHLDPRYATGSEANCTSGLCCRSNNTPDTILNPAPQFGAFHCDSPYALAVAGLQAIPQLTGTKGSGFDMTLYTGDLVAHDPDNELSRDYVEYVETVLYDLFKRVLGSGPVYAALGNHDSYNVAQDAPHAIGEGLANQFSWNYDHVAALWEHENWVPDAEVQEARAHYAGYSLKRADGLRIITLNTDMWIKANYFNYFNMTNPDVSGILRFLTDELQAAEDAGERVWIMGHVLTGWDGSNGLTNPTNLFYQIVDRFSPHVIANIFWGHTHEDQVSIYYANNATVQDADNALVMGWIGPGMTPLTGLNSGFRVYEVDSATFEVLDAHTWKSDVSAFPTLNGTGPVYEYEYNTRQTYGTTITGWGASDPLNATWWHKVTEAMEADNSLVSTFNTFQGKSSARTKPCTGDCVTAKICYIRSGSCAIARQNCILGFGSVQN